MEVILYRRRQKMSKKALITGITGQDGPYLAKLLLSKGYDVKGLTRDISEQNAKNLRYLGIDNKISLLEANLLDLSNVMRIVENYEPQEIYNLASQSSVRLSFEQPIGTLQFNIISTANLLEAIRIVDPAIKFYQASSSEMFGRVEKKNLPIDENFVFHPVSPYGISKAAAHWTTVNYREAYGIFAVCGILFNHESVLRGNNFVTKKVIATAVRISKGTQEKLRLGNIEIKRDWGYAPEYVRAMWLMLQQDYQDDYVIATNEAHSLKEFVELAFASLGLNWEKHVTIDKSLYRPSDIDIIYGSLKKAKERLGWVYNISFDELVELLVREELKYGDIIVD